MNYKLLGVLAGLIGFITTGHAVDADYMSFERKVSKMRREKIQSIAKETISGDNELWELYRGIMVDGVRIEKTTLSPVILNRLAFLNQYRTDSKGPQDIRQRLRDAFLVVVMQPLVNDVRNQILQVLSTLDEYIAYWQYQQDHPILYFFHKSPTKWVSRVSQKEEVAGHLRRLKSCREKHYTLLGDITHLVDSFDYTGQSLSYVNWVAQVLALIGNEMCEQKGIKGKDLATYQQLLPLAKDIFKDVHNYAQKAERRLFAKSKKPGFLERNWFTGAIAAGLTATGAAISLYNRVRLVGLGNKLVDNVKKYGYEYPKDRIKETFLMDEKQSNNDFIKNIDNELSKIKRATAPRDYEAEARKVHDASHADGSFDLLKQQDKKPLIDAQENAHKKTVLTKLKDDYITILNQQEYKDAMSITPNSAQPDIKNKVNESIIKEYAAHFVDPNSGKTGEAIDLIQQAIKVKIDEIKCYTTMKDDSTLIEQYLKKTTTNNWLGLDSKNLSEVNKVLTQLIKVTPKAVDLVPLTFLLLEGRALQTASLQEPIVNIIDRTAKEFDTIVESIVKPVRGVAALVVALPVLATAIGGTYGLYRLYGALKHKPNYKKMRAILIDISHLLNLYDQEETKNMNAGDYGNLLYLVNKLKKEEKEMPIELQERFRNSIEKLEKPIPMRNKIRIVDLMIHEFINPIA